MDLKILCKDVCAVASQTAEFIKKESAGFDADDARLKGKHDFVSYVDIEAEKQLTEGLAKLLPQAGFIAEEGTGEPAESGLNWIIDPLDGTTNFMHGLPVYSISIGLVQEDRILLGVILNVPGDELFYAYDGGGAWLNDKRINVSQSDNLNDSLIATGFPFKNYERLDTFMASLEYFIRHTRGVRRMGSAAIDLAYVACGRYDGFYEYGLNRWDVTAGIIIIREAGGRASDFSGNKNDIDGSEIVASNSNIFDAFSLEVARHMNNNRS